MKADKTKLRTWQDRLKRSETAYQSEYDQIDRRERQYMGDRTLKPMVPLEQKEDSCHVRNISAELIEAQVDSNLPAPKVTARREGDEDLAKLIEDMIRNEMDRLPMEMINDMMERTVPIQGGAAYLVEWDNTKRTHYTIGEISVTALHPKMIIPQDGVTSGIEDMDYIFLKLPQTKEYIRRRYGVDVSDESEEAPEVKAVDSSQADDMVTQYVAYYRNDSGGIGLYSWVGDTQLEDLEDYQARRLRRCTKCGAIEPLYDDAPPPREPLPADPALLSKAVGIFLAEEIGAAEARLEQATRPVARRGGRKECPYCGGTHWKESTEDYEEIWQPIYRSDGSVIEGTGMQTLERAGEMTDELGLPVPETVQEPARIPFYKPDIYPVILQRNVSVYGKFLGDSDLDKIADQQNTVNRMEAKIIDKLLKSGSYISLPDDASIRVDPEDGKIIRVGSAASKALIEVYDMQGNVAQDMSYLQQVYEESRQIIGITDSFQGRRDATATSGKAKEIAAAQSAGRLESKRIMKNAAYAALFEAIFKFKLAYADEPRPVVSNDLYGNPTYKEFNRFDFLERDAAGDWAWNDQFLFATDTAAPLASNREAMWQENRMNLQTGAYGDPTSLRTLILFWSKMEMLHYPGAGETRQSLEEELEMQEQARQQQEAMQRQAMQRQAMQQPSPGQQGAAPGGDVIDPQTAEAVIRQAQQDAAAAVQAGGNL